MKRLTKISWLWTALIVLALPACGGFGASGATATIDTGPIFTEIASTALALQTQTVLAYPSPTDTPQTSPTPEATNTPLFTDTPLPGTPSVTATPLNTLSSTQDSCDNLQYIADVTIPDGYSAQPGETLEKTWSVKNLGPCTWTADYALVYAYGGAGTDWNKLKPQPLSKTVAPGDTINITIVLKAPKVHGDYGAYFIMQNDKGANFPPLQVLTIFIKVQ